MMMPPRSRLDAPAPGTRPTEGPATISLAQVGAFVAVVLTPWAAAFAFLAQG